MSTLTQFIQGDSFLGEYIPGVAGVWGYNPTFTGKEYLKTGVVKPYSSDYAGLATNFKQAVYNTYLGTTYQDTGSGWTPSCSGNIPFRVYPNNATVQYVGGNYHKLFLWYTDSYSTGSAPFAVYGSSLTGSATAVTAPIGYYESGNNYGGALFNSGIHVISINASTGSRYLYRSTGGAYSNVFTPPNNGAWSLAGGSSLIVGISTANANTTTAGSVITSSNGSSWTSTATSANLTSTGYVSLLGYSTVGGCFIAITSTGLIWTSTDGVNWTSRTAPSGMPTSVTFITGASEHKFANSSTATVISVGSGKLLRTTNGTSFTLIDLGGDISISTWFTSSSNAEIQYISPNFVITTGTYFGFSADDGVTFTMDYAKQNTNAGESWWFQQANGRVFLCPSYTSGIHGGFGGFTMYEYTGRVALSTPQYVGLSSVQAFASGSNLSTYLRIK